ncbi:Uncharacterized protein C10orf71, partial [Chaetura pelagica]
MQGNKKYTEGHSDSSSIGSLLDDADREVSSLTDRAFKSLCVAELEDSYNEPDLAISPDFALQFSAKFHPGTLNHTIKKSNICKKPPPINNEHTIRASTFQQLPKCAPEEKKIAKNNTFATERKKLNLSVPGPRNNKHVSKVSSLIKTFDKTADQGSEGSLIALKQPITNSFQKCKLNHGNDIACWDDTDILSVDKEVSEFSEACQDAHCLSGKQEPQERLNNIDLNYCDSDGYYPVLIEMSKVAKSNFSRSSKRDLKTRSVKVNEPAKKCNFLHSENSAFESWNVHKKLTEKEKFVDVKTRNEGLAYLEERPFIKGSHIQEHKFKITVAKKKEKDFQTEPTPPEATFSIHLPAVHIPQGPLSSETEFPAEALSPQLGNTCPPWRRQRATKMAAEKSQTSNEKFTASHETLSEKATGAEAEPVVTPLAKQVNSGSIGPSFNITELLTPIIPPKQEVDLLENELIPLTTPPIESAAATDQEGSMFGDYRSQDSCKLRASSLLFNLRDVRKRVKSLYTPSPLLRALEEKNKTRQSTQESTNTNVSLSTLQENSCKNIAEQDDITSVLSGSVHEKDNKTDLTGQFTDSYLTLSSHQTTADLFSYQTGDNLQEDDSKHKDL